MLEFCFGLVRVKVMTRDPDLTNSWFGMYIPVGIDLNNE